MMQRDCTLCGQGFQITDEDLAFHEEVSPVFAGKKYLIPPPTLCPQCRIQRRMAWRNHNFVYRHEPSTPERATFSMWTPESPFPSFTLNHWFSDGWDQHASGQEIDFTRPFFQQWKEVEDRSPHFALDSSRVENCDYSNNLDNSKNLYLCFNGGCNQDCITSDNIIHTKDCIDCTRVSHCELCADCIDCTRCYSLQSSQGCENCSDSLFLLNCQSCAHCIGCVNLQRKEYCVFNEQKTKEEYEAFQKTIRWDSFGTRQTFERQWRQWALSHPHPHAIIRMSEGSSGNHIVASRDVRDCVFIESGEHLRYCQLLFEHVDHCQDITLFGTRASYCYEGAILGLDAHKAHFCLSVWDGTSNMLYCKYSVACHDCFGCIGLHRKQYCILNKQYTKEEYEILAPKLIEHMKGTGEWGEFFPISLSIPYNRSLAQQYFPLDEATARSRGYSWYEEPVSEMQGTVRDHEDMPPSAMESLLLRSEESRRLFRLTLAELKCYQRFSIPLPRTTYDERMAARSFRMGGLKLHDRQCAKTGRVLSSVYSEEEVPVLWDREVWEKEFRG